MNEQIRELAERSGLKVESWMTNPPKPFQILGSTEQFEKFAELIVKECYSVVNDALYNDYVFDNRTPAEIRKTALKAIKEHFGVK